MTRKQREVLAFIQKSRPDLARTTYLTVVFGPSVTRSLDALVKRGALRVKREGFEDYYAVTNRGAT